MDAVFRKFFAAVILAVFMLSAQIVSATNVDWNSAPKISSKAQLARYVENERRKGNTIFYVILTNGLRIGQTAFAELVSAVCDRADVISNNEINTRIIYEIIEYPGTHVANAYLSREPHMAWKNLTAEEQKLYNIAVGIVDKAKKYSSLEDRAYYIHNEICNLECEFVASNAREKEGKLKRPVTAIGLLIDKKANCQGFSDTFYMLGRMCGLNVSRMRGDEHMWNIIEYGDGKFYGIDVMWDYQRKNKMYFNAPEEIMKIEHSWDYSAYPKLQKTRDNRYYLYQN